MARESLGPAVVAGEVIYSSVSAVQKFLACPRAWWLRYVARVPDKPPSRNARLGTAGHARWQRYLETGDDRELAGSERVVLAKGWAPQLPLPRSTCLAEVAIHTTEGGLASPLQIDGVPLVGYVDVVDRDAGDVVDRDALLVQDWKYKGDIDQYVACSEDLVDPGTDAGVQMIGYALAVAVREDWPGTTIELRHVTMGLTGAPDARITRARLTPAQAGVAWAVVTDRVAARGGLREVARLPRWQDVPCDRSHCDRYGGCAYRARCHDLVAQLLSFTKGGPAMGIFDKMSPPVAPSTPAAPASPPETKLAGGPLGAPDRDRRLLHIDVTPPDAPQLPTAATAVVGGRYLRAGRVVVCTGEAGGWQLFAVEGATGPDGRPIIDRVPLTDPCPPAAPPLTAPPPVPAAPVAATPPADPPAPAAPADPPAEPAKRRGRPPKAPAPESSAPAPAAPAAPTLASPSRPPSGVHLYFGCGPVGIATLTLHSYVAALDAQVRQGLQDTALDVRLSQSEPLKYKGWQAVLAIAAQNSPPPPGHYVVLGYGDDRIDAVAQALIPLADLVVR